MLYSVLLDAQREINLFFLYCRLIQALHVIRILQYKMLIKVMKKKVHKLRLIAGASPFKLLGISSHENDYRLTWAANSKLGLRLIRSENITTANDNSEKLEFSVFQSIDEDNSHKMNLISNSCPNGFLIKEMKNIDFFMQIYGDISQPDLNEIVNGLKSIDIISAVFEIVPERRKKTWNLPLE
jgi:hypothetical protein